MTQGLHLIPIQLVGEASDDSGALVLLRPKFVSPKLQWLQKLMWKPHFRVKLDDVGAFIWRACDGTRTVEDIYRAVREEFGEKVEPVESRTGAFLNQLIQGRFLTLKDDKPE